MQAKRVILVEFNKLTPALMERFISNSGFWTGTK